jgi:hypothetical protein
MRAEEHVPVKVLVCSRIEESQNEDDEELKRNAASRLGRIFD